MKKIKVTGLAAAIIAAAIFAISYLNPQVINQAAKGSKFEVQSVVSTAGTDSAISDKAPKNADNTIAVPKTEGIVPDGFVYAKVTGIVDGDTIKAEIGTKEYRVRLLCIDTPESVKKGLPVQPYGKQASEKIKELLLGKEVTLVFEKDIDDRYGRLLAFVIQKDGSCVNAIMVEQGLARLDVVRPNTEYRDYFSGLQDEAVKGKRGLWALPEEKRPFMKNKEGYYVPRYFKDAA